MRRWHPEEYLKVRNNFSFVFSRLAHISDGGQVITVETGDSLVDSDGVDGTRGLGD